MNSARLELDEDEAGTEARTLSTDLAQIIQDYMPLVRHAVNRVVAGTDAGSCCRGMRNR